MDFWAMRERQWLCDLAVQLGPTAPTLCEGWTVDDLVTHLCVREHSLVGLSALRAPSLGLRSRRATRRWAARDFADRIRAVRAGGYLSVTGARGEAANLVEFVVHHQDIARANGITTPDRPHGHARSILTQLRRHRHRLPVRVPPGTGVLLRDPGTTSVDLRRGPAVLGVVGPAVELALWAFGRHAHARVDVQAPDLALRFAPTGSAARAV